ncbi:MULTISPECIES: class I SAM-dependent methyltransferase [unclassified Ruegeria]|uniref:class I SAM-dependent methyltransferase n=1 Tax=unclassified Ruegeria TaxID=2625375 RepID=UPI001492A381|nr:MULTISPECIES: SAM-dependent methyltransferase [unclassified Ruegeria]NOD35275.1 class I SAM-dependent methyltransferase [Ruegeria sp. HKCCD7296]NOE42961.1 class I SAM-dependent methyltransferase [Ruegeria sp. HKCCD7319]
MTLTDHLVARIRQDGPMSVADYMAECLLHPTLGYYTTRDPLGTKGDFTTAPEISQMFGELIGLSLAQCWMDQGKPTPFTLCELGPGRGTLMADILRATRGVPGFHDAARVTLVEVSPAFKQLQAETLKDYAPTWIDSVADLPDQPLFLVANEFFDALPIRQFLRDGDGWSERLVGERDGALLFGRGPIGPQAALKDRLADTKDGDLIELCAAAIPILTVIAGRIASHGGAALIVDYGDWHSLGDTLQALQNHERTEPLAAPGQADLTAHVDFEPLAETTRACGCRHTHVTPQGVFLERLGITARAQALSKALSGSELDVLIAAHRRLTHPDEMGNLFKVMGLFPAYAAPPPGLEP